MSTMSLHQLCQNGRLKEVSYALARAPWGMGEDVNKVDQYGQTGLMHAICGGHNAIIKLLLTQPRLDVNVRGFNGRGSTALNYASNNFEVLKMLLAHPSMNSHNARNSNGETPLMTAIRYNSMDCIKELLKDERVDLGTGHKTVSIEIRRLIDEEKQRREREKERKGQRVVNENRLKAAEKNTEEMVDKLEKKYDNREKIQILNNEKKLAAAEKTTKKLLDELEKKYEEREKIQMVNNEKRMKEMIGECRRRFEEKEMNEKIEIEARLAATEDSTKKIYAILDLPFNVTTIF